MSEPHNMPELSHLVQSAIEVEAMEALDDGRATLSVARENDEPVVRLKPRNAAAASLEIYIDTDRQVTCFAGGDGLPYEVFSSDPTEIVDEVRGLAKAVIAGQYCERVNDTREKSKIIADWGTGDRRRQPHYNVLRPPKSNHPDWQTVTYEPY